jgi:hypothetical protein
MRAGRWVLREDGGRQEVEHVAALALQSAHADPKALTLLLDRRQQAALVEALLQGRLADGQRLVDGLAEALAGRERRLRLQVQVSLVEPADALALPGGSAGPRRRGSPPSARRARRG